jgi:hypothetical protein
MTLSTSHPSCARGTEAGARKRACCHHGLHCHSSKHHPTFLPSPPTVLSPLCTCPLDQEYALTSPLPIRRTKPLPIPQPRTPDLSSPPTPTLHFNTPDSPPPEILRHGKHAQSPGQQQSQSSKSSKNQQAQAQQPQQQQQPQQAQARYNDNMPAQGLTAGNGRFIAQLEYAFSPQPKAMPTRKPRPTRPTIEKKQSE